MSKQGERTGRLGEWIHRYLKCHPQGDAWIVVFDHGTRGASGASVAAIHGFCGNDVGNANRLTEIDIMLVRRDGPVRLLIEIEERQTRPKQIIADAVAAMLCNACAVTLGGKRMIFRFDNSTELLVAGTLPLQGTRLEKVRKVIEPRLRALSGLPSGITGDRLSLVFHATDDEVDEAVKARVKAALSPEGSGTACRQDARLV